MENNVQDSEDINKRVVLLKKNLIRINRKVKTERPFR